jgi:hypothetical protein
MEGIVKRGQLLHQPRVPTSGWSGADQEVRFAGPPDEFKALVELTLTEFPLGPAQGISKLLEVLRRGTGHDLRPQPIDAYDAGLAVIGMSGTRNKNDCDGC